MNLSIESEKTPIKYFQFTKNKFVNKIELSKNANKNDIIELNSDVFHRFH